MEKWLEMDSSSLKALWFHIMDYGHPRTQWSFCFSLKCIWGIFSNQDLKQFNIKMVDVIILWVSKYWFWYWSTTIFLVFCKLNKEWMSQKDWVLRLRKHEKVPNVTEIMLSFKLKKNNNQHLQKQHPCIHCISSQGYTVQWLTLKYLIQ